MLNLINLWKINNRDGNEGRYEIACSEITMPIWTPTKCATGSGCASIDVTDSDGLYTGKISVGRSIEHIDRNGRCCCGVIAELSIHVDPPTFYLCILNGTGTSRSSRNRCYAGEHTCYLLNELLTSSRTVIAKKAVVPPAFRRSVLNCAGVNIGG
jgi:hypothetical protein